MNHPLDDLIDCWGDLQIPWTAKAKMIAAWGAAHSPVNANVKAASAAMICGKHAIVTAELSQAMKVIDGLEAGGDSDLPQP